MFGLFAEKDFVLHHSFTSFNFQSQVLHCQHFLLLNRLPVCRQAQQPQMTNTRKNYTQGFLKIAAFFEFQR